jgi:uncharacterized protein YecT (DUF1311 family)
MRAVIVCAALLSCLRAPLCAAADDCSAIETPVEQRECLETLATKTDGEVERIEGQLRSRIALWEQGPVHISRSLALFEQESVAYRAYRQTHCALLASSAAGGNGASDMRAVCEVDLDRDRIAAIRDALGSFDPGD